MANFEVIGFSNDADQVVFKKSGQDDYIYIKHTLPKNKLVAFLDISPDEVTKDYRNELLELARQKGRMQRIYSLDNVTFQKNSWFETNERCNVPYRHTKFVAQDQYEATPCCIDCKMVDEWIKVNRPKNITICNPFA